MSKAFHIKFEKAIHFLVKHMPPSHKNTRKPVLFHDIRVGVSLYNRGYKKNIIIAGLLHDTLEWTKVTKKVLKKEFGSAVTKLVQANTKDDSITGKNEKTDELIKRCVKNGQNALIIKTADILDSFQWYTSQNNTAEIQYCMRNANAIFKFKPDSFKDIIFKELQKWKNTFKHLVK